MGRKGSVYAKGQRIKRRRLSWKAKETGNPPHPDGLALGEDGYFASMRNRFRRSGRKKWGGGWNISATNCLCGEYSRGFYFGRKFDRRRKRREASEGGAGGKKREETGRTSTSWSRFLFED